MNKVFYPHIEGLRGLAILMVLLYHIMPTVCNSGYLGVDIFLVISGYFLMKGIWQSNRPLSFFSFIGKKLLRLVPPTAAMVLVTCAAVFFLLAPCEIDTSMKTAMAALFMCSNIQLNSLHNNYFNEVFNTNPFLHTWYLGVTMQAFLFFGLLFTFLRRYSKKIQLCALVLICTVSVGFILLRVPLWRLGLTEGIMPVYYSATARLWELSLGGLMAAAPSCKNRYINNIIALAAPCLFIGASFSSLHVSYLQPLIVATGLILLFATDCASVNLILGNRLFRFIGKISFSVYLWHWPIVALCHYYDYPSEWWAHIGLILICLLCGWLGYIVIERKKFSPKAALALWGATLLGCYTVDKNQDAAYLLHPRLQAAHLSITAPAPKAEMQDFPQSLAPWSEDLTSGNSQAPLYRIGHDHTAPSFIMLGDSHNGAFHAGMDYIAKRLNISGYRARFYCTPFYDRMCARTAFRFNETMQADLTEWLKRHDEITHVVLVQRWSIRLTDTLNDESLPLHYDGTPSDETDRYRTNEKALREFLQHMKDIGKNVIIMGEAPILRQRGGPGSLHRNILIGTPMETISVACTEEEYTNMLARPLHSLAAMEQEGLCRLIHTEKIFEEQPYFPAFSNGDLLMLDGNHVSPAGARYLADKLFSEWQNAFFSSEKEK